MGLFAWLVFCNGVIPTDWQVGFVLGLCGGGALGGGGCCGLELTDQVMSLLERVLGSCVRRMVGVAAMRFGIVPGRGTTGAIFVIRQLQEKSIAASWPFCFAFVDLEGAFDRVPRSLGGGGVGCACCPGHVYGCQGPRPCWRFVQRGVGVGVPWELLYAEDLAVMADSLQECIERLKVWKEGLERKGLRVNVRKTGLMVSGPGLDLPPDSEAFPCAVCRGSVGVNSIQCSRCIYWVHKKCSVVGGRLAGGPGYVCPRCCDQARPIDDRPVTQVGVDGTQLDVESNFCYLGDMLCAGGGCGLAIITKCSTAWGKFKRLLHILTSKHVSLRTCVKVFNACVRSALLHGSETWAPTAPDLQRLRRNNRSMVRWICRVKRG